MCNCTACRRNMDHEDDEQEDDATLTTYIGYIIRWVGVDSNSYLSEIKEHGGTRWTLKPWEAIVFDSTGDILAAVTDINNMMYVGRVEICRRHVEDAPTITDEAL